MRRGRLRPAGAALAAVLLTGCAQFAGSAQPPAGGEPAQGSDRGQSLPPVVDHVRTTDPVVFLTFDDSAERDPHFADFVRAHRLPVTLFLTDTVAGPAYGHFARLRSVGASLHNHTLDHRSLRGLPYAGQRAEICGQQTKLRSRFGVRSHLFRPPYGTYDTTTLRAAADCGITAVVLWRAALSADGGLTYTRGDHRLHPGDIVAVDPDHPTGTGLSARTEALLETIEEQGLRVGRLGDYL
ncbi:polysaccharide deacetylase family protein [Streptomyces mutabilis]|uniref:polysaccharide deacetylase family protein n=1 Tax=Streptomyces TaxID=1883 RepID=UPI0022BA2567|nr:MULTISPECIES: polysaccharide deacetylase family protein [Streptomyces]MCZ9352010.1 polysaccharide deacetylase family protein [Streptomyces mutabilis]MDQ0385866.1 peptidoglycan/xylan/chitin deacetylase (PgdA/CDA1 family) [Streptomyces sp. DSM 42143]